MSAHRNYINGAWVESAAAPIVDRNPSDVDDVVGTYAAGDFGFFNAAAMGQLLMGRDALATEALGALLLLGLVAGGAGWAGWAVRSRRSR